MPVILDRLPLPNITWYTGISVLCLLCSVYYAGVQVKLHPDWKEQLQQRHNAMLNANRDNHHKYQYNTETTLHWGVFSSVDQDEEGFCIPDQDIKVYQGGGLSDHRLEDFCVKETFENILQATFYDEMCYLRYNSVDTAFTNFKDVNAARIEKDQAPYSAEEYSRRCQRAVRKLALKYNISNKADIIKISLDDSSTHLTQSPKLSEHQVTGNDNGPETKAPVNQCTTDTFYDSYERVVDSEVSLFHIPLQDRSCSDLEREMSPYLIPEIISFMFHEPLCIWTLINMAYCILILLGTTIQHMVFGELRVSEQQHIKDKFWNFVFYKFIFVFGVMNVKHMDEAVLWCSWFSVLGFLHLLAQLCKDRFDYLSFSGHTGRRTHIRLLCLLGIILLVASACLVISLLVGFHAGINTFAFVAAECILLIVRTLYVITRYSIYLWDITHQGLWEKRGAYVYATELLFELSELTIDMVHHIHMLVWGNIMLTMASLVICMQLRLLFYQLQHKVKTHRNYLRVRKLLARYQEVHNPHSRDAEAVTCAICWENVAKGRLLPCHHVFHTDCLLAWLPQHLSCPTCRHKLRPAPVSQSPSNVSLFSRMFSRRSSDPLDANNFNSSNNSSRHVSRNNSENSTPYHVNSRGDGASEAAVTASAADDEYLMILGHNQVMNDTTNDSLDIATDHKLSGGGGDSNDHGGDGADGGSSSLLDGDSGVGFWGAGDGHTLGSGGGDGGSSGGGDGWRYVSWLSSFSVEQRHTQLPPQRSSITESENSIHSMAMQVQQMFPHIGYSVIVSDLRRTRSILSTIDNILEDKLPSRSLDKGRPSGARVIVSLSAPTSSGVSASTSAAAASTSGTSLTNAQYSTAAMPSTSRGLVDHKISGSEAPNTTQSTITSTSPSLCSKSDTKTSDKSYIKSSLTSSSSNVNIPSTIIKNLVEGSISSSCPSSPVVAGTAASGLSAESAPSSSDSTVGGEVFRQQKKHQIESLQADLNGHKNLELNLESSNTVNNILPERDPGKQDCESLSENDLPCALQPSINKSAGLFMATSKPTSLSTSESPNQNYYSNKSVEETKSISHNTTDGNTLPLPSVSQSLPTTSVPVQSAQGEKHSSSTTKSREHFTSRTDVTRNSPCPAEDDSQDSTTGECCPPRYLMEDVRVATSHVERGTSGQTNEISVQDTDGNNCASNSAEDESCNSQDWHVESSHPEEQFAQTKPSPEASGLRRRHGKGGLDTNNKFDGRDCDTTSGLSTAQSQDGSAPATDCRPTTNLRGPAVHGLSSDHLEEDDVEVKSARGASVSSVGSHGDRFSHCPAERQTLLQSRQQRLYSTARDRFMARGAEDQGSSGAV